MIETLKEFKIKIGLDDKPLKSGLKQSETALQQFSKYASGMLATYASAKIFNNVTFAFSELATQLGTTSKMMGYNIETASALGNALKAFGGDTNNATATLNSLSSALQQAKFGGGALIEMAKKYGVNFINANGSVMNAEQLLISLGNQMKKLSTGAQFDIAKTLGLDNNVVALIQNSDKSLGEVIKKQKDLGVMTEKDFKISLQFNQTWAELQNTFKAIGLQISRFVLPIFSKLVQGFTKFIEYMKEHKVLIASFFAGMAIAMAPVLLLLGKMALSSVAAFAPFYAVVGIVSTVALAFEDIYGYFMGWDTITGDLVKKFPVLGSILEGIRPIVLGIVDTFKAIIGWITDPSWESFKNIFITIGNIIYTAIQKPLEYVKDMISNVTSFITNNVFGKFFNSQPAVETNAGSGVNNNYNINASVNQSITSATPQALANDTAQALVNSINNQRIAIGNN